MGLFKRKAGLTPAQVKAALAFPVFYSIYNPIFPENLRNRRIALSDERTSPVTAAWKRKHDGLMREIMDAWIVMEKQMDKASR